MKRKKVRREKAKQEVNKWLRQESERQRLWRKLNETDLSKAFKRPEV